ncbi:hypothetical protein B0I37DRAFT_24278 [Chaetomium sp. MPI-CAGE-AT-0009]|nr:hypothetical protein B0I37DRAFT_24278 [Chaetomium sp. MPI-CAGE-AT-0009]
MRQNVLLVALSAATVAIAAERNFTINTSAVEPSVKADWCAAQYNTCRLLCSAGARANDCDTTTLEYKCTCANGTAPGLEYYIQTIPTFVCEQAYSDCIAANTGSSRAQDECKTNIKDQCGTLDPTKAQADTPSEDSTTSAASSATASNAPASTSSSTAGAMPTAAYIGNGVAMVAAGVFAAML